VKANPSGGNGRPLGKQSHANRNGNDDNGGRCLRSDVLPRDLSVGRSMRQEVDLIDSSTARSMVRVARQLSHLLMPYARRPHTSFDFLNNIHALPPLSRALDGHVSTFKLLRNLFRLLAFNLWRFFNASRKRFSSELVELKNQLW
jgi:hypothetical protein